MFGKPKQPWGKEGGQDPHKEKNAYIQDREVLDRINKLASVYKKEGAQSNLQPAEVAEALYGLTGGEKQSIDDGLVMKALNIAQTRRR